VHHQQADSVGHGQAESGEDLGCLASGFIVNDGFYDQRVGHRGTPSAYI
jgi:hypothetical protein